MLLLKRDEISVRNSSLELETGDIDFSFNGEYNKKQLKVPFKGKELSAR